MDKIFSKNIKNLRLLKNLKQTELAASLSTTHTTIARWETGANFPDNESILKLAELFQVHISDLFVADENIEISEMRAALREELSLALQGFHISGNQGLPGDIIEILGSLTPEDLDMVRKIIGPMSRVKKMKK